MRGGCNDGTSSQPSIFITASLRSSYPVFAFTTRRHRVLGIVAPILWLCRLFRCLRGTPLRHSPRRYRLGVLAASCVNLALLDEPLLLDGLPVVQPDRVAALQIVLHPAERVRCVLARRCVVGELGIEVVEVHFILLRLQPLLLPLHRF